MQYRIFDRLYRPADNDRATALLLIGDPKQSIYGFRGADIASYLQARASMDDRHYLLTTNYRSTATRSSKRSTTCSSRPRRAPRAPFVSARAASRRSRVRCRSCRSRPAAGPTGTATRPGRSPR